jgi:hypothetical protein
MPKFCTPLAIRERGDKTKSFLKMIGEDIGFDKLSDSSPEKSFKREQKIKLKISKTT